MSFVVTPHGMKSWTLGGMVPPGAMLPQTRNIELLGLNRRQSYEMIYRTQPWIYALVNKMARGIARLPLVAYGPDELAVEADDSLQTLMRKPAPRVTGFSLREATTGALAIYGNSLTAKDRGDRPYGPVQALWSIPWRFVTPIAGENEPIAAYLIMVGGVARVLFPDDVIHHQWYSPNGLIGVSPLEPLRVTLALEDAAQRYSLNSFANGGRPSGVVSTEKSMNKPDRDQLKAELESAYGGVDNAFRIALLTHGLQWQPISHTPVEQELIALRQLTRQEACAAYDVNPMMLGITEHGGARANVEENHVILYQDTYGPWCVMQEETWERQLCDNERPWNGYSVKYDMGEFLRGNPTARSQAGQRWFQSATKTPNELRTDEGLDPVPGSMLSDGSPDPAHPANQVYIPVNMLDIEHAARSIDIQPDPQQTPDDGGTGGDVPSAEKVREFLKLAVAAGLEVPGLMTAD